MSSKDLILAYLDQHPEEGVTVVELRDIHPHIARSSWRCALWALKREGVVRTRADFRENGDGRALRYFRTETEPSATWVHPYSLAAKLAKQRRAHDQS